MEIFVKKIFFHDWHIFDIRKILEKAKKTPISCEKVEKVKLGQAEDLCYDPNYSVEIHIGVRCGCFFEYHKAEGGLLVRRQRVFVSFDSDTNEPHPETIIAIMELFGMDKRLLEYNVFFSRVKDKPTVINIF